MCVGAEMVLVKGGVVLSLLTAYEIVLTSAYLPRARCQGVGFVPMRCKAFRV
jgi:hypothetical protein